MRRKRKSREHPVSLAMVFSFMFSSMNFMLCRLQWSDLHRNAGFTFLVFVFGGLSIRWIQIWQNWRGIGPGAALGFTIWFVARGPLDGFHGAPVFYLELISCLTFGAIIAVKREREILC